jgi:hypothetical protein
MTFEAASCKIDMTANSITNALVVDKSTSDLDSIVDDLKDIYRQLILPALY